ncbi:MAG: OsmC family protein [Bryobacteraceae bacterium]|jgi:organic hydroperoxide reductase OsmC/OhrA
MKQHRYEIRVAWTGNLGQGTSGYAGYLRNHEVSAPGKPVVLASSDPAFRGDPARYNPEDLLVASLSACHMLWYLHLCAVNGVVVVDYADDAFGLMEETADGGGFFSEVTLRPAVAISADSDAARALSLHEEAHRLCFIANSVKFPVRHQPRVTTL